MNHLRNVLRRFTAMLLSAVMIITSIPAFPVTAYAASTGTLSGLSSDGLTATYSNTDDGSYASWTASGNTISGNVKSKGGDGCNSDTAYEATLTLTNNKSTAATLSFDYTIEQNSGTIQVAGSSVSSGGSYSGTLNSGDSIKIYLKSGSTSASTSIQLTNLNLLVDVQATTTFKPAENGSYTVDGTAITEETSKTQSSMTAYSVSATAASGYTFFGWYSETKQQYISYDASASLNFESNQTVTAIFISDEAPLFSVAGTKFADLNEANTYASTNKIEKIVLVKDGTLPAGNYTISSGVILLIPFDEAGTCYTTAPENTKNARTTPSVYRTLTMADGASITVNGAISVSAKHYAYGQSGGGAPDGKYGYIYMNDGSSITVNSGGAMYVYGFVSGKGTVTAKSGATVYENMQLADFRGGSATSGMLNNAQKIFPMNQYFIQNIEVKLTLEYGADEYLYTSLYAMSMAVSTSVHFIGTSDAMFLLSEGSSLSKEYLPDQDRLEVNINGDGQISSLKLTVMSNSIDSSNYTLPITNNWTINVNSGTTQLTQDVTLLPGSMINIANGATVQVTSGSSLYVWDSTEWTGNHYAGAGSDYKSILYSPTKSYNRKASDLVDARINVNGTLQSDGYVYTTESGADICSTEGTGKVVFTNGAGTTTATYGYKEDSSNYGTATVTSAKLHNGADYAGTDDEWTTTADAVSGNTYSYKTDKWVKDGEVAEVTVIYDPNGGEGEQIEYVYSAGDEVCLDYTSYEREGYTFTGWNTAADGTGTSYEEGASVTLDADMTLYAQWTPDTYTVTWVNEDGTELEKDTDVAYGTTPEYNGETPTKQGDAQYSYTFSGWTPEVAAVTGDVTYKATYEQTTNKYTITWKNEDGTELKSEQVAYGEVPSYSGETPTKTGDAKHSYTFAGWTPTVAAVTADAEYTATFTESINTYTVIWQDWDETELEKDENVEYGTTPEYNGNEPSRTGDAQYSYTFKGWSPAVDTVTGNITYTAVYEQTVNQYTITWKNGDEVLKTEQIAYGETPVWSGENPTKTDSTGQYTYTFKGWAPDITEVTGDATYTAEFDRTENTFTVTWLDADGTELEKDEGVAWGSKPSFDKDEPTKAADEQYTYTFKGWNPGITNETTVTADVTYTAVYDSTAKTYTVTWKNADGTVLETDENVAYGTMPTYNGETPTKAADSDYTYSFNGWDPAISAVTGDVTYTATYTSTAIVKHAVTFDANGGEGSMDKQTFVQGVGTKLTANAFTREGYKFTGWNTAADGTGASYADEGTIIDLQEDITLYAQWKHDDGWFTDSTGKQYYEDGELQKTGWTTIDDKVYYLDSETGYAATSGLYWLAYPDGYSPDAWDTKNNVEYTKLGYGTNSYFLFNEDGEFQNGTSGLYTLSSGTAVHGKNGSTYTTSSDMIVWMAKGELPWHPGLVTDGTDYYYFPTDYFEDEDSATKVCGKDYYISKTNGLELPSSLGEGEFATGTYSFDADGKLQLRDGFTKVDGETYYYVKGAKTYAGLIKLDGEYYYINSACKVVHDCDYAISKTNGLLPAGKYTFDSDGKLIRGDSTLNGIVKGVDGIWHYYVNGVKTYAGLIQIDGSYYYVNSNCEVIHGRTYRISKTNGLKEQKTYEFDSEGKLIETEVTLNGIVKESDGTWYYYVDGVKTYAGLIEIDGAYFYVNSSCKVVHGQSYTISKTNGLLPAGTYVFGENGAMVRDDASLDGIVKESDGTWRYYVKGVKVYAGLIQIDGSYYYVNSNCEVIHGRVYRISKTNGLMNQGAYTFDADGKMVVE